MDRIDESLVQSLSFRYFSVLSLKILQRQWWHHNIWKSDYQQASELVEVLVCSERSPFVEQASLTYNLEHDVVSLHKFPLFDLVVLDCCFDSLEINFRLVVFHSFCFDSVPLYILGAIFEQCATVYRIIIN